MQRHYFISDDLDELKSVETELERRGITTLQIHVLSERDADVEHHELHEVQSFMKNDVVHSSLLGAVIGIALCVVLLLAVQAAGFANSAAGWVPFIFLAVVVLGFCTWEGGLRGIQEPNHHFLRFQKELREGRHIFFVDVDRSEETLLNQVVAAHPALQAAGVERAGAHWIVAWQQKCLNFVKTLP